jgi:CubicO group peptidase (beta-lactamase class C family)
MLASHNVNLLTLTMALTALTTFTALPQTGMNPERLSEIPVRIQQFVNEGVISGAVMMLALNGEIVLHEAVGYQDVESQQTMKLGTIFQIQSMTKQVTAVGIMILIEEGRLRLNDPVEMHLPEFQGQKMIRNTDSDQHMTQLPQRPITIRDLLTHTSGMPHGHHAYRTAPEVETLEEVVASNAQLPLEFEPGTNFLYSNLGFETLGRIIEVVSGKPYEQFLQERIFRPLGMEDSFFFFPFEKHDRLASIYEFENGKLQKLDVDTSRPFRYSHPGGGMFSTAADMFIFYQMTLQRGNYNGQRILSAASVEVMTAPHVSRPPSAATSGYGFGWWVVQEPIGTTGLPLQSNGSYGHAGYWGTIGWVDPKTGLVGVFLIQYNSNAPSQRGTYVRAYAEVFITMATAAIAN